MCMHLCTFVCVVLMCVYTCRIGQNVPKKSPVVDTGHVENWQSALQDDHEYSTVDNEQLQMFGISDNPAYDFVPELDQKPMQEDDRAYSNLDICQQEEVVTSGNPRYGTAARAASASDK